jgi:hypothetical protein
VPKTGDEVQALRMRIDDLNRALQTAAERRNSVANRLREADIGARPGYEARLGELDSRILQIEREITAATMQLGRAPTLALLEGTTREPDPNLIIERISNDIVPIVAILSIFVFAPFAMSLSWFLWKRATPRTSRAAVSDQATHQRLEQLQQSVDTIAIEVERISEGQRFVTRLLSEREHSALGAGAAEPVPASKQAGVHSER